jgi:predicted permease
VSYIENFVQDVRYGLRQLRRNPGFTAVAILTLALGWAAVNTIFALVETVVLRPLDYPRSERIFTVAQNLPALGSGPSVATLGEFHRWQQSGLFVHAAALKTAQYTLLGTGRAERLFGASVTPDFFRVFDVQPFLRRGLEASDATPGRDKVVVLSCGLWKSSFAGDRGIVGRSVRMSEGTMTVIGVMPPRFDFPRLADVRTIMFWAPERTEFWKPLTVTEKLVEQGNFNYYVLGRLKDGVTPQRAAEQFQATAVQIFRGEQERMPAVRHALEQVIASLAVYVVPLRDTMPWGVRGALWMLLGGVGLLLALVLFNLGNLLLTRNAGRLRELVVREALGATRRRIFREGLVEQLLLVAWAAIISVLAAEWAVSAIRSTAAARLPRLYDLGVDARVTMLLIALSLVTAFLFGALPLVVLRGSGFGYVLQSEGRTATADRRTNRLKSSLMASEIAVSLVLLIGAGLLIRSFANVMRVNPGFDPHNLLTIEVSLNPKTNESGAKRVEHVRELLEAFRRIPGVEDAAVVNHIPLMGEMDIHGVRAADKPPSPTTEAEGAEYRAVDANYFRTMRIPLVRGREFRPDEPAGFAVVNLKMAARLCLVRTPWASSSATGTTHRSRSSGPSATSTTGRWNASRGCSTTCPWRLTPGARTS